MCPDKNKQRGNKKHIRVNTLRGSARNWPAFADVIAHSDANMIVASFLRKM